jgi:hypothetical protein
VRTGSSVLAELAAQLCAANPSLDDWAVVDRIFGRWAESKDTCRALRTHLATLPPDEAAAVVARSKEATTHFAWCLRDEPAERFSLWLHEYKPRASWLPGYANSVHNHRYHFCTTIVSGGYQHERFTADVDPTGTEIRSVTRQDGRWCEAGSSGCVLTHEFHRIPVAVEGTMTLLVKSRMRQPWSLSFDPATGLSQRHVPLAGRLAGLAGRL